MDKKKLFIILGGAVGGIILLIIIFVVVFNVFFSRISYDKIEDRMVVAARKYFAEHKNLLPVASEESEPLVEEPEVTDPNEVIPTETPVEGENPEVPEEEEKVIQTEVDVATLVQEELIKDLSKLVKDKEVSCTGKVIVKANLDGYSYFPHLECGETYKTQYFVDKVLSFTDKADNGSGLYDMEDGTQVFRGDNPYNYITFSGNTWRILKVVEDKSIYLVSDFKTTRVVWDDRYNADRGTNVGINNYKISRIREQVFNYYNAEKSFDFASKNLMMPFDLCVGRRAPEDTDKTGSLECASLLENEKISLIPIYDYMRASVDDYCDLSVSNSCGNYNYMSYFLDGTTWWSVTGNSLDTSKAFKVDGGGADYSNTSSSAYLRFMIKLDKDTRYVSGNGSVDTPYKVR